MYKIHTILAAALLSAVAQAFSLDTSTKHWNYTTNSLASTTSQKCKDAYSTEIACDEYLVQLVDADEERYFLDDMEPENFTQTCTASCHSSLTKYIANVEMACTERGDAAVSSVGFLGKDGMENVPVQTVGHIFLYHLMRSCAKDDGVLPPDFSCSWTCALAYYWNRHFYPYSDWSLGDPRISQFDQDGNETKAGNNMVLTTRHGDIMNTGGWRTIQKCGYGNPAQPPFDVGLAGLIEDIALPPISTPSNATSTSEDSTASATTATASGAASDTPSPIHTGTAARSFSSSLSSFATVMLVGVCTIM
ncbi:hypothetical protein BDV28DRAFT_149622 [Aspergillus coremiiformis]|uniref:Uncharacterized protein n=1 Tax=Aspergillus coremiiformis TaxID=138285 RepID=A0A5N6Z714_9EURO|nr:hypothetical protein BDV28DRAFT_149622 [Aspergillus coremiiformis]